MSKNYRRMFTVTLCGWLVLLPIGFGQKGPTRQKKVFTPEQQAYQQKEREFMVKRLSLQEQSKKVFDAEIAHENAGDCPEAESTYDLNICFGKQVAITEQNLKMYEGFIRELLAPAPTPPSQPASETPAVAGPALTPEQPVEEFDRLEQSWQKYRGMACAVAFHQFEGGTGGASFELECDLKLTHNHFRELEMIYGEDLHL